VIWVNNNPLYLTLRKKTSLSEEGCAIIDPFAREEIVVIYTPIDRSSLDNILKFKHVSGFVVI